MGFFKKLTNTASQIGSEVTKSYKGALSYKSPEEIAVPCEPRGLEYTYNGFII